MKTTKDIYLEKLEKAKQAKEKKKLLIDNIVEDLQENFYDSQEYIFDLVRESLLKKSNKELLGILS